MRHLVGKSEKIEYLVVGHVTRDKVEDSYVPGGTVTYSGRLAKALGCRTAVLTSAREDYDLREVLEGLVSFHVVLRLRLESR